MANPSNFLINHPILEEVLEITYIYPPGGEIGFGNDIRQLDLSKDDIDLVNDGILQEIDDYNDLNSSNCTVEGEFRAIQDGELSLDENKNGN